jgi:tetratricopeptide (TPR) repeat protein
MYLPVIGLALGVIQTMSLYINSLENQSRKILTYGSFLAVILISIGLGYMTYEQNIVWQDPVTFYNNIISMKDPAPEAHNNLGVYYYHNGNYAASLEQYESASHDFETSTDSFTSHINRAELDYNTALTLLMMPEDPSKQTSAINYLQKASDLYPDFYLPIKKLAEIYSKIGNQELANFYAHRADILSSKESLCPCIPAQ